MLCVLLWGTFVLILQDVTWGWDTMHSHVVWCGQGGSLEKVRE